MNVNLRILAGVLTWTASFGKFATLYLSLSTPSLAAAGTFSPGELFLANGDTFMAGGQNLGGLMNITGGGDFSGAEEFAVLPSRSSGQVAWSKDLSVAYVTLFDLGVVAAVDSEGSVSTFATGLFGPRGIIVTGAGKILVSEFWTGTVKDISAGGDFEGQPSFATGLGSVANLLERSDGSILVAEQSTGELTDISGGGDFVGVTPFASGLSGPVDIVESETGDLFVSELFSDEVTIATEGGDLSGKAPFATGVNFLGLAILSEGQLIATIGNSIPAVVIDITAGGAFDGATAFAFNISYRGDSGLDTVPTNSSQLPVAVEIPSLPTTLLVLVGVVIALWSWHRGLPPNKSVNRTLDSHLSSLPLRSAPVKRRLPKR